MGATERRWLVILTAVALALRGIWLLELEGLPWGAELPTDSSLYDAAARRIAAGDWLLDPHPLRMSPGYFYALGIVYRVFGAEPLAMRAIQAILGASSVPLAWALAREVLPSESPLARLVTAALVGLLGPLVFFDGAILPESIASALVLAFALALARAVADPQDAPRGPASWGGAALLLGLVCLFRPNGVLLAPLLVLLAASGGGRRERLTRIGAVLVGLALALAPLTARNAVASGRFVPLTSHGGLNLYIGNGPGATGTFRAPPEIPGGASPSTQFEAFRRVASERSGRPLDEVDADRFWVARTAEHVAADPLGWAVLLARKVHLVFNARELGLVLPYAFAREATRTLSFPFPQAGWVAPFGLLGLLWAVFLPLRAAPGSPGRARRARALGLVTIGLALSVALVFVTDRYRAPLLPLFAIFSVLFVLEARRLAVARAARPLTLLGVAAALAVLLDVPVAGRPHFERDWVELGEHSLALEEPERALDAFERALEVAPGDPRAAMGAAFAHHVLGHEREAEALWARVAGDEAAPAELRETARSALARRRPGER